MVSLWPQSNGESFQEFNPCHSPVDGKFCSTVGGTRMGAASGEIASVEDARRFTAQVEESWQTAARGTVANVARELQFPLDRIDVVSKEPREFTVGGAQWKEAGHYDPTTGRIEVNIKNLAHDHRSLSMLVAHEIAHAKWEVFRTDLEREAGELREWGGENLEKFRMNGEVRPEYRAEFRQQFPTHVAIADTWGHGYMAAGDAADRMKNDDGFTEYSKAYWKAADGVSVYRNYLGADRMVGSLDRAVSETLSEVAAWRTMRRARGIDLGTPSKDWRRFSARVSARYRAIVKRGGRG